MSTYSEQCSAVGSFAYAEYFKLYVELVEKWVDNTSNTSYVDYNVYCQSSGSGSINSNHFKYFAINDQEIVNRTENVNVSSPNAYIGIASGTIGPIQHDTDGRKTIGFYAEIQGSTYGVAATLENSFELTQIPRYTTVTNSERGKSINSISINWVTTDASDWTQYKLNDGEWQNANDTVAADNKSGYYTISGLQPNTQYSVKTRSKRADSQLWCEAETISITTYDIAKISDVPNIEHGNNLSVSYSNPSGSSVEIGIFKTDGSTEIAGYRSCSGNSYTFQFTDEELDKLYKSYGENNQITLRVYIKTANNYNYLHYKEFVVTLKGNQKTIKVNSETWKRGKIFVKINDTWKRGVVWIKEQGSWKRGI